MEGKTCCQNWGSSIYFIANLLNFVLATAVFTIPFPMHEVGIFLGTIILSITCFISVVACTFIIESLALKNAILKQENSILEKAILENEQEEKDLLDIEEKGEEQKEEKKDEEKIIKGKDRPTFISKTSLASNIDDIQKNQKDEKKDLLIQDDQLIKGNVPDEDIIERSNTLYIYKRFEISKLSEALPKAGYYFDNFDISNLLYIYKI